MSEVYDKNACFAWLYCVHNGVVNGDPDRNDGGPRVRPDNGHAYNTQYCGKRRCRDYVALFKDGPGMDIWMRSGETLASRRARLFGPGKAQEILDGDDNSVVVSDAEFEGAEAEFSERYWDSMFGLTAPLKSVKGDRQITGCVQMEIGTSLDPVKEVQFSITRCASNSDADKAGTGGARCYMPFAFFRQEGRIIGCEAKRAGLKVEAVETLWEAMQNAWYFNMSDARGTVTFCGLYVWEVENPNHALQPKILQKGLKVHKREGVDVPADYDDYEIHVHDPPPGVTLRSWSPFPTVHD